MTSPLIVSASGIRGIVGETMTPAIAERYGAAFGRFLADRGSGHPGSWVLVGRDSRSSGRRLAEAAGAGLRAVGLDVRDAGMAPTPTLLLSVGDNEPAVGGLVVTASHNPIEWNGLKLATGAGRFLMPAELQQVQQLFEDGPVLMRSGALGAAGTISEVVSHHIVRILDLSVVAPERIAAAGLLVALDCVHGAAGAIMPGLLAGLGCRVVGIGLETDGLFPRNPEPTAENLADLGALVRESGADVGLAVDPDGDRLSLVDGEGRPVGEDWTLALAAEYVLSLRAGPLVTNLSSSQSIEDAAERAGVPCYRTAVGEARVAQRMLEVEATIGGEGNGGVILPELSLTRDAAVAAALILSLLARDGARLEALLADRPDYRIVKRKIAHPETPLDGIYDAIEKNAEPGAEVDRTDGLRLCWRERRQWLHVRPSGTEPVLRIIAESIGEGTAAALADWAGALIATES